MTDADRFGTAKPAPPHVPPELVRNVDLVGAQSPYESTAALHEVGRVFYNLTAHGPQYEGGIWVLTQAEDIRTALQTPEVFSSHDTVGFSRSIGEAWPLIPLELDPPESIPSSAPS